jgi:hypothetical protein
MARVARALDIGRDELDVGQLCEFRDAGNRFRDQVCNAAL